jgi:hypothetical protein
MRKITGVLPAASAALALAATAFTAQAQTVATAHADVLLKAAQADELEGLSGARDGADLSVDVTPSSGLMAPWTTLGPSPGPSRRFPPEPEPRRPGRSGFAES